MQPKPDRRGFSLIEALVVLAISGLALAIIFSIGNKAGETGFRLGRGAMAAADLDVSVSDLRSLIRSLALRPPPTFLAGVDRPIVGAPNRLEGDIVMERATQCAPAGWSGRMTLEIDQRGLDRVLTCIAGERSIDLITTQYAAAAFSYSTDGRTWSASYTNAPEGGQGLSELRAITLFVRFDGGPTADILEASYSGSPNKWTRPFLAE